MSDDSLAILPRSMGQQQGPPQKKKLNPSKFIPSKRGGLITANAVEEECPYTFSDSPAYVRAKKEEEQAKRAAELESKEETRGFLRSVEDLAIKQKWEEASQVLERRTAVPSGLFLVTRALLRWKFSRYGAALQDADEALKNYGGSTKAGPLAAAFACFAKLCLGSEVRDKASCSKDMQILVDAWEQSEQGILMRHALGQGLFKPRIEQRMSESGTPIEGIEAEDASYTACSGLRIGYVILKNQRDATAPVVLHFHGSGETAADYRSPALAEKYRDIPVHLLAVDYRGYGWSGGEPSLATFLRDAEKFAEKLPELFIQHGFAWPYPGGIVLSGRSLGAQVAVHLAAVFPTLFRAMVLDSALSASATGDRLGRAPERSAALKQWRKELEQANLEILHPLDADLWCLSVLDKIRAFNGQLLVIHGLADEIVPYESAESLHAAASSKQKELVLLKDAGHNNIGQNSEYWTALRRFTLKVQLDSTLPSVGPTMEHLCAVCAEKAVSKCGRCQKVWYCSRSHQAEHWKVHKAKCAGEPSAPKVVPEAEASAIVVICAELSNREGGLSISCLLNCLTAAASQEQPLEGIAVSWRADTPELTEEASAKLQLFKEQHADLQITISEAATSSSYFERVKAAMALLQDAPRHAWVTLLSPGSILSPRFCASLLPSLRRAAADARVTAVRCLQHAGLTSDSARKLASAAEVELALSQQEVEVRQAQENDAHSLFVRLKSLQSFVEGTPESALKSKYCELRFVNHFTNTFGKKVMKASVPDTEWMQWREGWMQTSQVDESAECNHGHPMRDREIAQDLLVSFKRLDTNENDTSDQSDAAKLMEPEKCVAMVRSIRQSMERSLILRAGDAIPSKDLRDISTDLTSSSLQAADLDQVIGIQRWARQTAADISKEVAEKFQVTVSD
eukprot:TRINITY_DN102733_c0_g1_i1.p1 TRINITY_DN102733_c0_g1~~TRINITY_DN102733_c0_g1_i1.p1  ORF type:complete len:911 (+),score=187.64 TRINITY_DN102733_c0_g1_i1:89-2821(+)